MDAPSARSKGMESLFVGATARVLDLAAVLELVAGHAQSPLGGDRVRALEPIADAAALAVRHDEVAEALDRGDSRGHVPLGAARPLAEALAPAATSGVVLEPRTLLEIAATARVAAALKRAFGDDAERWPRLASRVADLPDLGPLVQQIEAVLDEEGEVRDRASPELSRLRRQLHGAHARVRQRLERLTRDGSLGDALQDAIVTERGGRLVVPVRAGQRDRVPGVVHDSSSSGQTLFVEPLAVLEEQNRLADLVGREREEVRRLLAELTGHVRAARDALLAAEQAIGGADALQAIARYTHAEQAVRPQLGAPELRLRGARHPLLDRDRVVPLDLEIPQGTRAIVITGPNTGGKTVALKTVGLLAAMAQCGVPVPAAEARLPVYPRLAADIGDDQDVTANLSTFSGHLRNIARFLEACEPGSLVLLDELGTGTDPAEGSALGIALVERFVEDGATVLVSTHHDALKAFAHRHEGVQNAAMEFDHLTLAPTYRIRVGRPGRSNALEIASRLGLDGAVLARARELQSDDAVELDAVIRGLESDSAEAAALRADLQRRLIVLEEERAEMRAREVSRAEEHRQALDAARRAVRDAVSQVREEGERKLRELETSTPASTPRSRADRRARWAAESGRVRKKAVERLAEAAPDGSAGPSPPSGPERSAPGDDDEAALRRGERVTVAPFGLQGVVLHDWSADDAGAEVQVDAGGKRLVVRRDQVSRAGAAPKPRRRRAGGTRFRRRHDVGSEIDLHGMTVEQALAAVDKYLDDALLAELFTVRLIHGFGTLRLRDAIHEHLRNRPGVASFESADPTVGGVGVTVVHLED